MKKRRIVMIAVILTLLMSTTVYAQPAPAGQPGEGGKQMEQSRPEQDPVKRLEQKKAEIGKRLDEGRITKEEAEKRIQKIDETIRKIKEFDKLTLPQKKEKLVKEFETRINEKVHQGKLTRDEAKARISEFKEKIGSWDGSGYPFLRKKGRARIEEKENENKSLIY